MLEREGCEAARVIKKCGGATKTAALAETSVSTVSKWQAPKEKGGADGKVPPKHALTLLRKGAIELADLDDTTATTATNRPVGGSSEAEA